MCRRFTHCELTLIWGGGRGLVDADADAASGDSWTTTGFELDGPQPRDENPMGNPEFPYVLPLRTADPNAEDGAGADQAKQ